jgi:hypothetical protein
MRTSPFGVIDATPHLYLHGRLAAALPFFSLTTNLGEEEARD